ncbi:MAG: cell division protein ZapA, partial [Methylococcales bacterium]
KEYRIGCLDEERHDLLESARHLDQKMREIKVTEKVVDLERIAVIAALNIIHELAQANRRNHTSFQNIHDRLIRIQEKVDAILDVLESDRSGILLVSPA